MTRGRKKSILDSWKNYIHAGIMSPHRRGRGHIVFGADPVGVCVGVTLSCVQDIS